VFATNTTNTNGEKQSKPEQTAPKIRESERQSKPEQAAPKMREAGSRPNKLLWFEIALGVFIGLPLLAFILLLFV
jgi:hypothetical protein